MEITLRDGRENIALDLGSFSARSVMLEQHAMRFHTIDPNIPVKVIHVSRGKRTRAEPIAALYEQKRVHHVGMFAKLEDQYCTWIPGERSPDRLDAAVHTLTELMLTGRAPGDLGIS